MRVALDSVDAGQTVVIKRHDKEYLINPMSTPQAFTVVKDSPQVRKGLDLTSAGITTLCKHGAHPDFCKFKSQGKPCK